MFYYRTNCLTPQASALTQGLQQTESWHDWKLRKHIHTHTGWLHLPLLTSVRSSGRHLSDPSEPKVTSAYRGISLLLHGLEIKTIIMLHVQNTINTNCKITEVFLCIYTNLWNYTQKIHAATNVENKYKCQIFNYYSMCILNVSRWIWS